MVERGIRNLTCSHLSIAVGVISAPERSPFMKRSLWYSGVCAAALTGGVGCLVMGKSTFLANLESVHAEAKGLSAAEAESLIDSALVQLYNPANDEEFLSARSLLEQAEVALANWSASNDSDAEGHYRVARATHALAEWFEAARESKRQVAGADEKTIVACLESTVTASKRACTLNDDLADAHRLWGDTLGHLIRYKGMPFAIMKGSDARKQVQRALEIDPKSSEAWLASGRSYFYTPRSFGGDLGQAVSSFRKAVELATGPHQKFMGYVWLAQGVTKQEKVDEARELLGSALEIYPNSDWARSLREGL